MPVGFPLLNFGINHDNSNVPSFANRCTRPLLSMAKTDPGFVLLAGSIATARGAWNRPSVRPNLPMTTSVASRGVVESTPSSLSVSTSLDPHPKDATKTKPIIKTFPISRREIPTKSKSVTDAHSNAISAIQGSAALTADGS